MISVSLIAGTLAFSVGWDQPAMVAPAIDRALPLLQQAATVHVEQKTCFGCHNQGPTLAAIKLAQADGYSPGPQLRKLQSEHITDFIAANLERFRSGQGTGGGIDTAGTMLLALEALDHPADEHTEAVVEFLLKYQAKQDHWTCTSNRPPSEASHFATTYLAIRGLNSWSTDQQKPRAEQRIAKAQGWLLQSKPKETEDYVFRLLALKAAKAEPQAVEEAASQLLALQRPEGGWGQLPSLPSDAYATGTALVALLETGLPKENQAVRRGVRFLLATQLTDGSWQVKTRSKPFQKYYESGFPHEKDQFISASASGWATQSLLLARRQHNPE